MLTPWKESYDQPRQHIKKQRHLAKPIQYWKVINLQLKNKNKQKFKKQRHYFVNKGPSSQGYGFSSGRVWM